MYEAALVEPKMNHAIINISLTQTKIKTPQNKKNWIHISYHMQNILYYFFASKIRILYCSLLVASRSRRLNILFSSSFFLSSFILFTNFNEKSLLALDQTFHTRLNVTQGNSAHLSTTQHDSAHLSATQCNSAQLSATQYDSARLSATQRNSEWLRNSKILIKI